MKRFSNTPIFLLLALNFAGMVTVGCGAVARELDDPELAKLNSDLAQCRKEGRDSNDYAAYEACKKDGGLK